MIRVFEEVDGVHCRLVLELRDLHCSSRDDAGPVRLAQWHGRVVTHDVDLLPHEGMLYQVYDDTGPTPLVFTGCQFTALNVEQDGNFVPPKHSMKLALRYVRCLSVGRLRAEQRPVSL